MRPIDGAPLADAAARVDAVLARRPAIDGHRCSEALAALTAARDGERDPVRRGALNLLVSLVLGVKHPLGDPPWEALQAARRAVILEGDDDHG